ncbi:MAG: hypothetical protein IPQ25_06960 [Chitinophagaceae bacterium]|nr:hypothetical protein [Chitinophagaceae bacterium]
MQGNFLNTATYTTTSADDSLILSGAGNVTFNGGASTYTNLWINKAAAANRVTLTATAFLSGKLDYDQGVFTTDPITNPSFVFSAPTTAVFDFAAGKEIIGNVRRTGWANGSAVVFNQPNMQLTTNAGTAPTDITVTMIPLTESGDPTDNEREVKRKFQFAQTGGTGFTADVRFPYVSGELNTNTEANLVPWGRFTGVWNGRLTPVTRDAPNDWVSTTGITQADFVNEWKLADPRYTMNAIALLRGPWNSGTGLMGTNMNSGGLLDASALGQPFNTTPFNYPGTESVSAGFFAAHPTIVDWVLCELRIAGSPDLATSGTIVGRKPGFVLSNGTVVDLDGVTPIASDYELISECRFYGRRHRNHLGVMSNSLPSNAIGTYTNDYRVLANAYKPIGAPSDPMVLLTSSSNYGFWGGDANKSGVVNGTDVSAIKNAIAASSSGYLFTDVNLSNSINGTDVSLTKGTISVSGSGGTPGRTVTRIVKTNIPD